MTVQSAEECGCGDAFPRVSVYLAGGWYTVSVMTRVSMQCWQPFASPLHGELVGLYRPVECLAVPGLYLIPVECPAVPGIPLY